jgi:hypothetical protein
LEEGEGFDAPTKSSSFIEVVVLAGEVKEDVINIPPLLSKVEDVENEEEDDDGEEVDFPFSINDETGPLVDEDEKGLDGASLTSLKACLVRSNSDTESWRGLLELRCRSADEGDFCVNEMGDFGDVEGDPPIPPPPPPLSPTEPGETRIFVGNG